MLLFKAKFIKVEVLKTKINATFAIHELTEDDDLRMTQCLDTEGYLVFNGDVVKREVLEAVKDRTIGIDDKGFSPSQKLRASLFQFWVNDYEGGKTFEEFYTLMMNRILDDTNKKLDEKRNLQRESD